MFLTSQGGVFTKSDIDTLNQALAGGAGPGQVFYVDALAGNDYNTGLAPTSQGSGVGPFRTINEAIAHCVAGRGDTVFVFAGSYAENVVVNVDGITLAGALPGRYDWPDIVPSTGVPVTVTAQGVVVTRVRCAGTAADALVQRGNGFTIQNCVLDGDGTASKAGLRLLPSDTDDAKTASEGFVLGNVVRGNAIGICFDTGAAPAVGVGSSDNLIQGNRFYSNTLDVATADAGGGVYSVHTTLITQNSFEDKIKATYIDLTTTNGGAAADQTGAINGNTFANDSAPMTTTQIKMVGTGFTFSGNFNTSGVVVGSALD